MDEQVFTYATRHHYRQTPCPSCGQKRELGWVDVSGLGGADRWRPNEKCRNRQCEKFNDPTSLA